MRWREIETERERCSLTLLLLVTREMWRRVLHIRAQWKKISLCLNEDGSRIGGPIETAISVLAQPHETLFTIVTIKHCLDKSS